MRPEPLDRAHQLKEHALRVERQPRLDEDRHRLLVDWNSTQEPYPHDACIHDLIEAQARQAPDALAVKAGDGSLTYGELDQRSSHLARYLQRQGVNPDDVVALYMDRSVVSPVGMLGVLKAGGAYMPLDPTYPEERLDFMLQDSGARILVTQDGLPGHLSSHHAVEACLDPEWGAITAEAMEPAVRQVRASNLAYVIYTSGSTGRPKGVLVTHRNLVHSTWARKLYYQDPVSAFLLLSSFSFDSSVAGIYWTLCFGGVLNIASESVRRDPAEIAQCLREQRISHLLCVPSLYGLVLDQIQSDPPAALRIVVVAGEACTKELVQRHMELLPHVALFNEYGPTEATVWSTVYDCRLPSPGGQVPIGQPIPNVQVYLLDDSLEPVPIGATGELYIGGAGIARGYLHRPDLTAQRFISNPFDPKPQARLYRTGDLARHLPDGRLEFLGRSDEQVKIHGFRVELGEVEATLREHPAVREVVVAAREDVPGLKRLIAYVVLRTGQHAGVGELRAFLQERVPEYMTPASIIFLDALPLSPNGKVDRKALPAPDPLRHHLSTPYVAPRTTAERLLAEIWQRLLNVDSVGIHDSFTDLGGDSLLSMRVLAQARDAGLRLAPDKLAAHATIAELAAVAPMEAMTQTSQRPVSGFLPLTPRQRWFFQKKRERRTRVTETEMAVHRPLDPLLLAAAVQHLLEHHDALRMRFRPEETKAGRAIIAEVEEHTVFRYLDHSRLAEEDRSARIRAVAENLRGHLSLEDGPLIQVAYLDAGPHQESRLLVLADHLVVDAYSLAILLEDLETAYEQLALGRSPLLPPKTTSVKYWAERLVEYADSPQLRKDLEYWHQCTGMRESSLLDTPQGPDQSEGQMLDVLVGLDRAETSSILQDVPWRLGLQFNDLLVAAVLSGFADLSGLATLMIEMRSHGRAPLFEDVDLSHTVGWFTAVFPMLLETTRVSGLADTARKVHDELRRVPKSGTPYDVARYITDDQDITKVLRSIARPHVSLNYQGQFDQLFAGLSLFGPIPDVRERVPKRGSRAHPRVQVAAWVQSERLHLRLSHHERTYPSATIRDVGESILQALRSTIITPPVGDTYSSG